MFFIFYEKRIKPSFFNFLLFSLKIDNLHLEIYNHPSIVVSSHKVQVVSFKLI